MKVVIFPALLLTLLLITAGCSEPPVRDPVVTVSAITLSDVSLQTMTVNTTVNIFNPNPVGARLKRVAFNVTWSDGSPRYLGHGETSGIDVNASGNTTVTIPVAVGTLPAAEAVASLLQKGSLTVSINGTATVDLTVASFDKPFSQNRTFTSDEFGGLLPATIPGTGINLSEGIAQLGDLLGSAT
jgi:LEA14-like dessication related protein